MPLGNPGEPSDYVEYPTEPPKERDDYERRTPYWLRPEPERSDDWAVLDNAIREGREDEGPLAYDQRPDQIYHPPEWFDFPCASEWRCGYSGEPYEPDAREVARARQMEADMAVIERTHNEERPFDAALGQAGIRPIADPANAWFPPVPHRYLRPLLG